MRCKLVPTGKVFLIDTGRDMILTDIKNKVTSFVDSTKQSVIDKLQAKLDSFNPAKAKSEKVDPYQDQPQPQKTSIVWEIFIWLLKIFYVLFCLLLATLVSNHLIMQPVIMRIFGFVATLFMVIINPLALIAVTLYYLLFAISRAYGNTKVSDPSQKKPYIPYIFTMLPISTTIPETNLGYILSYPFIYNLAPSYEMGDRKAFVDENRYFLESIQNSFPDFNEAMKISQFKDLYESFKTHLGKMHEYTKIDPDTKEIKTINPLESKE